MLIGTRAQAACSRGGHRRVQIGQTNSWVELADECAPLLAMPDPEHGPEPLFTVFPRLVSRSKSKSTSKSKLTFQSKSASKTCAPF